MTYPSPQDETASAESKYYEVALAALVISLESSPTPRTPLLRTKVAYKKVDTNGEVEG